VIYDEIGRFYQSWQGKKCIIGYSCQGREIYALHVGDMTGRQFIAVYAVHAREWITARLALKHAKIGFIRGGGWQKRITSEIIYTLHCSPQCWLLCISASKLVIINGRKCL